MTKLLLALLTLGSVLLQVGATPVFVFDAAAPLLPIALLAAWGTTRHPTEVWPALLLVAVALGVASEQRAGWYLLALLPTGVLLPAVRGRTEMERVLGLTTAGRLTRAALVGAAGTWAYLALLLIVAGDIETIPGLSPHLALAAASTGAVAALLACVLWPLRTQTRSLFA